MAPTQRKRPKYVNKALAGARSRMKEGATKGKSSPAEAKPLSVRSFDLVKGPPGQLGWSHLLVPDEAFGKIQFKGDVHYDDRSKAILLDRINAAYWDLIPDLVEMAKEKKVADKLKVQSKDQVVAYLAEKFKDPKEGDLIPLPHIQFAVNSTYMYKGEEQTVSIKLFDLHGAPLDLKAAKMGRESVVMPMFNVGVWAGASPFSKWAALPTLRLVGFQVLKLKSYARGEGSTGGGEVTDADLALLGENFQADDLSMFAKPAETKGSSKGSTPAEAPQDEMEDEIPF